MQWKLLASALALLIFAPSAMSAAYPPPVASLPGFSHGYVVANGIRLHYVIGGHGPAVVLLHGFPETWYAWRGVMPGLAAHHTVIVPDLRGAGGSERPAGGYDKKTMAEDVHALVVALGFRSIDLLGHDVGVSVAYPYAAAHRDEVRHLVLLDVPPQGTQAFARMAETSWVFRFHQQRDLPEALVAGRERTYLVTGFYRALAHDPDAFTPAVVDQYVRAYRQPGAMHAAFEWYRAFDRDIATNRRDYLPTKLGMPVLMLGGAQSGGPMMRDTAREIATDYRAEIIPECGHWLLDEQPAEVVTHLLAFLDGKASPSIVKADQ